MQVPLKIFIISLSSLLSHLGHCQITDKEIGKTPSNYTILLHSRENEKGLLMSYKEFKNGSFIEASEKEKNTLMTTMLLGSATYLYDYMSHTYSDFKPVVIKPNGFTTTSFQIKYEFSEGSIFISRIFKNQSGLNPMAAEDPNNYMLLYGFDIKDQKISNEIIDNLTQYLKSSNIEFGRVDRKK